MLLVSLGHLSIFLRLIKCHLPFIWIFCLFLFPFASLFRFWFGSDFRLDFRSDFCSDFRSDFLSESVFESDFGSDKLISLSYSVAAFSANFLKTSMNSFWKKSRGLYKILHHQNNIMAHITSLTPDSGTLKATKGASDIGLPHAE